MHRRSKLFVEYEYRYRAFVAALPLKAGACMTRELRRASLEQWRRAGAIDQADGIDRRGDGCVS